ncbi:hypothetical protein [Nonomuraea sp. NPDC023979]|uniref:hypothetical protein n=1 Tax=Nonomuraea sp. NPDC023979 TaxID=3154796 RepID=UPI0033C79D9A
MSDLHADADIAYHGMLSDTLPVPLLYVYGDDDRSRDYMIPIVKRYGLPQLRVDGPENAATLMVEPAAPGWQVVIGPGKAFTVTWPFSRPLAYGGGMTTPGWTRAALKAGECWLLVGPPHNWISTVSVHEVISSVWKAGGALGIVPVVRG